jgi:hypothetical protein
VDDTKFGDSPYYYSNWCNAEWYALPYLDDKYCNKKFPSSYDREWKCPNNFDSDHLSGFSEDLDFENLQVDV